MVCTRTSYMTRYSVFQNHYLYVYKLSDAIFIRRNYVNYTVIQKSSSHMTFMIKM